MASPHTVVSFNTERRLPCKLSRTMLVLITGGTGYVGSRVVAATPGTTEDRSPRHHNLNGADRFLTP
jgi:hypothetical protein